MQNQSKRLNPQLNYITPVKEDDKQFAYAVRGIYVNAKGQLVLNANVFATYLQERMILVQIESSVLAEIIQNLNRCPKCFVCSPQ